MTNNALIQTHDLVKVFGLMPVLRRLNLGIERGECVALLGPNGSGKSTLLRILSGLSKPTSGTITVGGWELPREAAAVRAQIGMVSHKPLLYENLTGRENLQFFARLYNLPKAERERRIDTLLERVGMAKRDGDLVRTYSRGMQQRLSIARALLHQPEILLFDEPYTGLDQAASAMLDDVTLESRANGLTIIMATHELDRAARIASRVVILARGVVSLDASTEDMDTLTLAGRYSEVTA